MFGIKKLKERVSLLERAVIKLQDNHNNSDIIEKAVQVVSWTKENLPKYNVGDSVLYNDEKCKVLAVKLKGDKIEETRGMFNWVPFAFNYIHWSYIIDNKRGGIFTVREDDLKPLTK